MRIYFSPANTALQIQRASASTSVFLRSGSAWLQRAFTIEKCFVACDRLPRCLSQMPKSDLGVRGLVASLKTFDELQRNSRSGDLRLTLLHHLQTIIDSNLSEDTMDMVFDGLLRQI